MRNNRALRAFYGLVAATMMAVMAVGFVGAAEEGMININTASADELERLQGVGPTYAAKIIQYREQNGPFQTPDEIMEVKGIGPKTFEVNKDLITIE